MSPVVPIKTVSPVGLFRSKPNSEFGCRDSWISFCLQQVSCLAFLMSLIWGETGFICVIVYPTFLIWLIDSSWRLVSSSHDYVSYKLIALSGDLIRVRFNFFLSRDDIVCAVYFPLRWTEVPTVWLPTASDAGTEQVCQACGALRSHPRTFFHPFVDTTWIHNFIRDATFCNSVFPSAYIVQKDPLSLVFWLLQKEVCADETSEPLFVAFYNNTLVLEWISSGGHRGAWFL